MTDTRRWAEAELKQAREAAKSVPDLTEHVRECGGDPGLSDPILALLKAYVGVREGRWIMGAPTHVLAEFLNVLESDGWRLVYVGSPD